MFNTWFRQACTEYCRVSDYERYSAEPSSQTDYLFSPNCKHRYFNGDLLAAGSYVY